MSLSKTADLGGRADPHRFPPGPPNVLLQTAFYFRDPLAYYEKLHTRYGSLFSIPTWKSRMLVTAEPEGAREVFSAPPRSFGEPFGADVIRSFVGAGSLLSLSGDAHRRERQLLSPSFHGAQMRAFSDPILETTRRVAEQMLQPGAELPASQIGQRIALEVILRAIFGVSDPKQVDHLFEVITSAVSAVNPFPLLFPFLQREFGGFGPWAKFLRIRDSADSEFYALIREARSTAGEKPDILSSVLASEYEDGSHASDERVRDALLTLVVAGHETTATAIAWCLYELHRNPHTLARLRDEIAALGAEPSADALREIPYLEGVVREALRLHPAVPDILRIVEDGFEIRGHTLAAGDAVSVAIPLIHADPALYPQPSEFRPERFEERRYGPHEYVAFGGGHRHCLGMAFALSEATLVLATLVADWEFQLVSDRPLRTVRRNVVLAAEGGVPLRVIGRRSTSVGAAA